MSKIISDRHKAFRDRLAQYKKFKAENPGKSYWDWKASIHQKDTDWGYYGWKNNLPQNLKEETSTYDLYGAYKAGLTPRMEEDGYYHLGSRDPYTGRILKTKEHDTYNKAIDGDVSIGYYPYEKDGWTYTKGLSPLGDISGY